METLECLHGETQRKATNEQKWRRREALSVAATQDLGVYILSQIPWTLGSKF